MNNGLKKNLLYILFSLNEHSQNKVIRYLAIDLDLLHLHILDVFVDVQVDKILLRLILPGPSEGVNGFENQTSCL